MCLRILWWDHCKVSEQKKSIGGGGYTDPRNKEYMFTETQIFKAGFEAKSLDEIKEYIKQTAESYPNFELVPSFFLDET